MTVVERLVIQSNIMANNMLHVLILGTKGTNKLSLCIERAFHSGFLTFHKFYKTV